MMKRKAKRYKDGGSSVDDTQDYASLGRRAGATSPFSGPKEFISEEKRAEKETSDESDSSTAGKGARNMALEDDETPKAAKKAMKVVATAAPKKETSSGKMSSAKDVFEKARPLPGKPGDKAEPKNLPGKPEVKSEPTPYSGARTRAGTPVKGREEPSKESVDKAMASLNERLKKQYKENEISFKPSKSPNRSYKSGGTIKSSASSRGDGIAQRGKTKGRIY